MTPETNPEPEEAMEPAMEQALDHTEGYMHFAIDAVNAHFGDSFAKQHPELVVGYMQTCASIYNTVVMSGNTHTTKAGTTGDKE